MSQPLPAPSRRPSASADIGSSTGAGAEQLRLDAQPAVLADIYEGHVNLAVWRAGLPPSLRLAAQTLGQTQPRLRLATSGSATDLHAALRAGLPDEPANDALLARLQLCVTLFAELLEPQRIGLRLEMLDRAMCPRFHVDHLAVRLVTTLCGPATQWLPEPAVDRRWLGRAGAFQPDEATGLLREPAAVQQLQAGDVALLKGEGWVGNEGHGLVHRSPPVASGERRLVLTLDTVA